MNIQRAQHLFPAVCILLLAATVAFLSFTREPADAFLFPRLISVVMLGLACWNFVRAVTGVSKVGAGLTLQTARAILPGLLVLVVYVFFAAKYLGFYLSSLIAFFVLFSLYDPASHLNMRTWVKRIIISVLFMLVIYALFTLLLKVQTPRGLFR